MVTSDDKRSYSVRGKTVFQEQIERGVKSQLLAHPVPCLIFPRTLKVFTLPRPDAQTFSLRLLLRVPILLLQPLSKLGSLFRFVDCRKACSQHLQAHIAPQQAFPHVHCRHHSIVLVSLVDIGPHPPAQNIFGQPIQRLLRMRLRGASKVCLLRGVNSGKPDMYLTPQGRVSTQSKHPPSNQLARHSRKSIPSYL